MDAPTSRDIELGLKCLETRRRIMREGYYRHREERLAYRKEHYAQKQAEQGRMVRPRKTAPVENEFVTGSLVVV